MKRLIPLVGLCALAAAAIAVAAPGGPRTKPSVAPPPAAAPHRAPDAAAQPRRLIGRAGAGAYFIARCWAKKGSTFCSKRAAMWSMWLPW